MMDEEKLKIIFSLGLKTCLSIGKKQIVCSLSNETLIKRTFQSQLECKIFNKFIDLEVWSHLALKTNTYSKEYLTSTVGKHILDQKKFSK